MLKRPNYIEEKDGSIRKVFCQVCGDQIAGVSARPKGSGPDIDKLVERFMRFPNYAEVKFQFDDGSMHVTNGCKSCMKLGLSAELMFEIYKADMGVMGMKLDKRKPRKVVAIDVTGSGLL